MVSNTAIRKIVRMVNERISSGFGGNGKMVFDPKGFGGAWYSSDSRPNIDESDIVIYLPWNKVTYKDIKEMIDNMEY